MQLSPRGGEEEAQRLIEARVVKDYYHVPQDPVVLKRCDGGALRRVEGASMSHEAICQAVLTWILANPDSPVSAGAIRGRQGHGANAYKAIVREIPAATGPAIYNAIRWGVAERILEEQAYARANGVRRKRLSPGPAATGQWTSSDLQEDLTTSDCL